MSVSVSEQVWAFLINMALGALCGVFFDVLRTRRHFKSPTRAAAALQDTAFFALTLIAILATSYFLCGTSLRPFQIAAVIIGISAYLLTLSTPFRRAMEWLHCALSRAARFFLRVAFIPVYIVYRLTHPIVLFTVKLCRKLAVKTKNITKRRLRALKKAKKRAKML